MEMESKLVDLDVDIYLDLHSFVRLLVTTILFLEFIVSNIHDRYRKSDTEVTRIWQITLTYILHVFIDGFFHCASKSVKRSALLHLTWWLRFASRHDQHFQELQVQLLVVVLELVPHVRSEATTASNPCAAQRLRSEPTIHHGNPYASQRRRRLELIVVTHMRRKSGVVHGRLYGGTVKPAFTQS